MFILKKSWLEKSAKQELHVIFSSAVADPGEGPGGPAHLPSIFFQTILRPKGPKNFFLWPDTPLSRRLDNWAPSLSEGLNLHCSEISFVKLGIFNKTWTRLDQ